ncbi:uncharacterized protein LOC119278181 isoform X3 [Triticum dicoccoides]|uniref:uncharacterized protein LOC119278181 isoform X3 n=1 Tax=Triticum dicoccoides TaxID=85692 RepID=UPI00188FF4B2|nr:uncharacterized protein LOC119278181 isoform X3 [Triticum dicoccoides]
MSDRPYSPDERMLQLLGEGTRTPLLPPATLPSAPSLWNTSTPSSEPPAGGRAEGVPALQSVHWQGEEAPHQDGSAWMQ